RELGDVHKRRVCSPVTLRRKAAMTSTDRLLRSRVESNGRPKSQQVATIMLAPGLRLTAFLLGVSVVATSVGSSAQEHRRPGPPAAAARPAAPPPAMARPAPPPAMARSAPSPAMARPAA